MQDATKPYVRCMDCWTAEVGVVKVLSSFSDDGMELLLMFGGCLPGLARWRRTASGW